MKRRILPFAALTFVGFFPACAPAGSAAPGSDADAPVITTSASQDYPQVTCTSADALACADTLQLAADTREQLAPLLKLGPAWRFPVHIHVMTPDDPLTAKINREAAAVFSQGDDHENRGGAALDRSGRARIHPAAIRHRPALGKIFREHDLRSTSIRVSTWSRSGWSRACANG